MSLTVLPQAESLQFGSYLLSQDLITWQELTVALEIQKRRPLLHLGEIFVLLGILDEKRFDEVLQGYNREARIGSLLISRGKLTVRQLATALEAQAELDEPLGQILIAQGFITPEDLDEVLALQQESSTGSADIFDKLGNCQQVKFFEAAKAQGTYPYFQPLESSESPVSQLHGQPIVLLAANSYLGLSDDSTVIEASVEATRRYGAGTSGSPMLNGTMDLHVALEQELAEFMQQEACLLYSTGFQTNVGVLSALVGRNDVVLVDSLAHASIHDGCQMSFGEVRRFNHNNMAHLEQLLKQAGKRGKLIVVDGVYSMDGDIADLPNIIRLARHYGARVMLDDAHGFGVLGMHGRGTAEYFKLLEQVDLIMLTFSKALGTIGGCVLGKSEVIRYLRHRSRAFIFSATLPPGTVAATRAALTRIRTDAGLRKALERNVEFMREGLLARGFRLGGSQTHILPLYVGDDQMALQMGTRLIERGVLVGTVVSPGVPPGHARLRLSVMASHTQEQLQTALEAIEGVARELGFWEATAQRERIVPASKEEPACLN